MQQPDHTADTSNSVEVGQDHAASMSSVVIDSLV